MCRLSALLSLPPIAMLATDEYPTSTEYAMVTPGVMIVGLTDDPIMACDAQWSVRVSSN